MGEISRGGLPDLDPKLRLGFLNTQHIKIIGIGEPGPPRLVKIKVRTFEINRDEMRQVGINRETRGKSRYPDLSRLIPT